jgi:hypothetical protein
MLEAAAALFGNNEYAIGGVCDIPARSAGTAPALHSYEFRQTTNGTHPINKIRDRFGEHFATRPCSKNFTWRRAFGSEPPPPLSPLRPPSSFLILGRQKRDESKKTTTAMDIK